MLDQQTIICELARKRYQQISMKYYYGMEECDDCSVFIDKYIHYFFMDEISSCGFAVICPVVTGSRCAESEVQTGCATIQIVREEQNISTPTIATIAAILP